MTIITAFEGDPFKADCSEFGIGEVLCSASAALSMAGCYVRVTLGSGYEKSYETDRDLVLAWRVAEAFRALSVVSSGDVERMVLAFDRFREDEQLHKLAQEAIAELIGQDKFDQVMNRRPPDEVIEVILGNQDAWVLPSPDLAALAEEVTAGVLEWRLEFEAAGVIRSEPSQS